MKIWVRWHFGKYFRLLLHKKNFYNQKIENHLKQIKVGTLFCDFCLRWQDAHVCWIWVDYTKIFHGYGHHIGHLGWNSWMFIHNIPFREDYFFKFTILQVWYFFLQICHIEMLFSHFPYFCFSFSLIINTMGSKLPVWPFI